VVVVGGRLVVVVVVGAKVVGTAVGVELPPVGDSDVGAEVVGASVVGVLVGDADVDGAVEVEVIGDGDGGVPLVLASELAPGCSLATTMPISAVAPVAARTAERVRRRRRTLARSRVPGELCSVACLIGRVRPF
jgi:hypothetical protein